MTQKSSRPRCGARAGAKEAGSELLWVTEQKGMAVTLGAWRYARTLGRLGGQKLKTWELGECEEKQMSPGHLLL